MPKKKSTIDMRYELLADELIKWNMNITKAYKKVYGVSQKVAEAAGSRMLCNVKFQEILEKKIEKRFKQAGIDAQRVIDRLVELANRCMQKEPVMYFDKAKKKYLQKTEEVEDPTTGEVREEGVWKFDSSGANSALEKLGKHFGAWVERMEHTGKDGAPLFDKVEIIVKK